MAAVMIATAASWVLVGMFGEFRGTGEVFLIAAFAVSKLTSSWGGAWYAILGSGVLDHQFMGSPNAFEVTTLRPGEITILVSLFLVPFIEGSWDRPSLAADVKDEVARKQAASYVDDVERGTIIGHRLISEMAEGDGHPYLLGWKVKRLVERRQFGPVETGVFGAIARSAILGRDRAFPLGIANDNAHNQEAQILRLHVDRKVLAGPVRDQQ